MNRPWRKLDIIFSRQRIIPEFIIVFKKNKKIKKIKISVHFLPSTYYTRIYYCFKKKKKKNFLFIFSRQRIIPEFIIV